MYKCGKCKQLFNKEDVTRTGINKQMPKYKYYNCRQCNTDKVRQYRATATGRMKTNQANYASFQRNKDKVNARTLLNHAVKSGSVIKPATCSHPSCVEKKIEAHHPDYTKPLNVIWMCRSHHSQTHRNL